MRLKLISCNVFLREASWAIARSPHVVDMEFTELGEHARSAGLRAIIQKRIDATAASGVKYDAILLLFGLCGNATVGLTARDVPLVMPRAHDCCTILLGSRQAFAEHFGDAPSTPFSSSGYIERGEYFLRTADGLPQVREGDPYAELVRQYGEDNAKYIWEQMHGDRRHNDRAVFIHLPQTDHLGHGEQFDKRATESGHTVEHLRGDIRLIENLIAGNWSDEEYLTVPPGQAIGGVYDFDRVVRAVEADKKTG